MGGENVRGVRAEDLLCPLSDGRNCKGKRCAWCMSVKVGDDSREVCCVTAIGFMAFIRGYNMNIVLNEDD